MEGAGVEEVGGLPARFEGVGAKGENVAGEAGGKECLLVRRDLRGYRLGGRGHCCEENREVGRVFWSLRED